MFIIRLVLILVLSTVALPAAGETVPVPGRKAAGIRLGQMMFAELEARALTLVPGPLVLVGGRAPDPLVEGLAEKLGGRGFTLQFAPVPNDYSRPLLKLSFLAGNQVELTSPDFSAGPWRVVIKDKPWMCTNLVARDRVRCSGSWELTRNEALQEGHKQLRAAVTRRLTETMPWRPWAKGALRPVVDEIIAESDHFLELAPTGAGNLWRGWVIATLSGEWMKKAGPALKRADRAWFMRLGFALLAALLAWGAAYRLDWWTRGYFTRRIRLGLVLAWLGLCCILGVTT